MTKYIAVTQLKGGVGKSTLAANICGYFLSKQKKVLSVDADLPQATLSGWAALAPVSEYHTHVAVQTTDELMQELEQADGNYDIVIIDSPPRIANMMKAALTVSDLALVPLRPTAPDIWATSDMLPVIQEAQQLREIDVRLVFNEYKPSKRNEEIRQEALKELNLPAMDSYLSKYVGYSDVMGMGKHALGHNHPQSKEQFTQFTKELDMLLK